MAREARSQLSRPYRTPEPVAEAQIIDFASRGWTFNIRLMAMTASYDVWLNGVEDALSSINMALKDWQKVWPCDFKAEFNAGTKPADAAMKANRFWWYQQNKATGQDCRKTEGCWLPCGHQGECQRG